MQAVYGVLMILGFVDAFHVGYQRLLPFSVEPTHAPINNAVTSVALFSLSLMGLRFFFVPRTLLRFLDLQRENMYGVLRLSMLAYLPVTLLHATLFYFICRAYNDLATAGTVNSIHSYPAGSLALRLFVVVALLLFVNAAWLLWIAGDRKPPVVWALNNLGHATVILGLGLLGFHSGVAADVMVVAISALMITNSVLDLGTTGECYILMESSEFGNVNHPHLQWYRTVALWVQGRQAYVSDRLPAHPADELGAAAEGGVAGTADQPG